MPTAPIPVHVAIRPRLKDSVGHAIDLDARLEEFITYRPHQPSGNFHGKIDFSQPPWHAPAAYSHLDLHSLSRKLERELRSELRLPWRPRGGSAVNTRKALEAVCRLAEGPNDSIVRLRPGEREKWTRRAMKILTELSATAESSAS